MLPKKLKLFSRYKPCKDPPTLHSSPKPDLFISSAKCLLPVHRIKLSQCEVIKNLLSSQSILLISEPLDVQYKITQNLTLQAIIYYFYGYDLEIADVKGLSNLLKVIKVLRIHTLYHQIQQMLCNEINKLNTFQILDLAYSHELNKVIQACFQYLEIEEFQQIHYYQFSLLSCSFKIFQIVIRRHHVLKQQGKIQGVSADIIAQLLEIYCRRNKYDGQILQRLRKKYVDQAKNMKKQYQLVNFLGKQSLRLHKLSYKNIGQSTTIYGNQSQKRLKQEQFNSVQKLQIPTLRIKNCQKQQKSITRMRRYSVQIDQVLLQLGANIKQKIGNDKNKLMFKISSLQQKAHKNLSNDDKFTKRRSCMEPVQAIQCQDENENEEVDKFLEDVSEIGMQGSTDLKTHEIDYNNLKPKQRSRSMLFREVIQQSLEESVHQNKNRNFKKQRSSQAIEFFNY